MVSPELSQKIRVFEGGRLAVSQFQLKKKPNKTTIFSNMSNARCNAVGKVSGPLTATEVVSDKVSSLC